MDLQFLKKVSLFKNFTKDELKIISDCFKLKKFKENELVIKENEVSNNLYIIYQGKVRITKKMTMINQEEERDKTFIILSADDYNFFGEIGFLGKVQKRTASAIAETDCELFILSKRDFFKIAEDNPVIGYKMLLEIAYKLSLLLAKADSDILKLTTALIFALN